MSKFSFVLLSVLVAACSAFAPSSSLASVTKEQTFTSSPFALNAVEDYDS